jgi:hypothetical protein
MQFHAKSVKNDLKTMDFLKHNFYFETEGVQNFAQTSSLNLKTLANDITQVGDGNMKQQE